MSTRVPFNGLALYRSILRLHRAKLEPDMRALGDSYVRQEFRAHRKVNEKQLTAFKEQWLDYKAHLELEADILGLGRDLDDDTVDALNEDQREQLEKLRNRASGAQENLIEEDIEITDKTETDNNTGEEKGKGVA